MGLIVFAILRSGTWGLVRPKPEGPEWIGLSPVVWLILAGGLVIWAFTLWENRVIARGGDISVQVLNEISSVARRKMGMSWEETHAFLDTVRSLLTVHSLTVKTHEAGLDLAQRYGLSIFDAMIAASALQAGCSTLWSEDMQHGMSLDAGLRVVNPFRA